MKLQHTMDDLHVRRFSDKRRMSDWEECDPDYKSDSFLVRRSTASGLTCTGDLDYPAAKSLNVVSPMSKRQQHRRSGSFKMIIPAIVPMPFEKTAKKVFTKELLQSNTESRSRGESLRSCNTECTFREDILECVEDNLRFEKTDESADTETSTRVRFSNVTIQEYAIQPCVNPGGNNGCPLTIGWEPVDLLTLDINAFEDNRSWNRRGLSSLRMVAEDRADLLRGMGYTQKEIMAGTRAANRTRRDRFETISRLDSARSEELIERVCRSIHNVLTCKKRREQAFLAPYKKNGEASIASLKRRPSNSSIYPIDSTCSTLPASQ